MAPSELPPENFLDDMVSSSQEPSPQSTIDQLQTQLQLTEAEKTTLQAQLRESKDLVKAQESKYKTQVTNLFSNSYHVKIVHM